MKRKHHILLNRDRQPLMGSVDIGRIFDFVASMNPLHMDKAEVNISKNKENENIIHCDWNSELIENFGGYVVSIDIYQPLYGKSPGVSIEERIATLNEEMAECELNEDYRAAHYIKLEIAELSKQIQGI